MTAPCHRWITLSPHLDDATLSVGGLIAAIGCFTSVEIWTVFSAASLRGPYSSLALWLHASAGLSGSRLAWARRLEDRHACRRLGATARHFSWKDAPYRKKSDGSFMYTSTRPGSIPPDEADLVQAIADRLRRSIRDDDVVLCPLAIGGHIDHLITREAAEASGVRNLMYYPEVPYQQLFPASLNESVAGLCPVRYTLRRDEIVTWIDALTLYVTQMPMLEDAAGKLPRLIGKYAAGQLALYRSSNGVSIDLTAYRIFG